jgi:hypothetical protein
VVFSCICLEGKSCNELQFYLGGHLYSNHMAGFLWKQILSILSDFLSWKNNSKQLSNFEPNCQMSVSLMKENQRKSKELRDFFHKIPAYVLSQTWYPSGHLSAHFCTVLPTSCKVWFLLEYVICQSDVKLLFLL